MASGSVIYSTLDSKAKDRTVFLAKIQGLQTDISQLQKTQADLQQSIKEKNDQYTKAQSDIAALEGQLGESRKSETTLRSRMDALIKEKESLTKYMENNNAIMAKLQKKIQTLQEERRHLEESKKAERSLSAGPKTDLTSEEAPADDEEPAVEGAPGSRVADEQIVDLGRIIIRKSTNQPASVEYINSLYSFVVLSAGKGDGLRKDSIVNITRNNRFIAKAVVKKVRDEVASAVTLPEWTREEIKIGDLVSVNNASP